MANLERLVMVLRSNTPCVWLCTDEEDYALQLVRDAAMDLGYDLLQWDVVSGVRDGLVSPAPTEQGTEQPAPALVRLVRTVKPTLCVMCDLVAHLDEPRTLRACRDLIHRFAHAPGHGAASKLIVIDHREDLPSVIKSHATRVELAHPTDDEVRELIVSTLRRVNRQRELKIKISSGDLSQIIANLRGLSRGQIERIIYESVWEDRQFCSDDLRQIQDRKRATIKADGLLEFVDAPTSMNQIGGIKRLKSWLAQRQRALLPEAKDFGIEPPRGVLMLGVQGAGKSLCAKAIATAWKRPLLRLDPSVLYDRYIGESERRLRQALRQAELMAPVVLWIDEIEKGFASAASQSIDGGLSQRMFGTLLTWMQDHTHPVFLAATANNVDALPPELLRKGRFDEIFFVDLPDEAAREAIFTIHLRKRNRDPARVDISALAAATEGFSGAEIEQAVKAALHEAFERRSSRSSKSDELTTDMLLRIVAESPPLSVTMAERITALRRWASGRCVPAQ